MNRWKRFLIITLSLCMSFSMILWPEKEAEAAGNGGQNGYTYTITLYSGDKGSFAGGDRIQFTGNEWGTMVSLDAVSLVSLPEDSKYYVKGIRRSGRDNNTALENSSFMVTEDADYVIAYGIKGEMVAYTVNYYDEDGNELAPSRTYYGNVGDKPVIAYLYIEGYAPRAYNLTKTLVGNAAENVFNFEYGRETGNTPQIIEQIPTAQGTTGASGTTGAGGADGVDETAEGGLTAIGPDAALAAGDVGPGATVTEPLTDVPDEDVPQNLVDLDDDEVPLADMNVSNLVEEGARRLPLYGAIVVAAAALSGLIFLIVWLKRQKSEEKKEKKE